MLLKKTQSLCPICRKVLDAEIFDEDGKVWIRRTCPDHGEAKHLYWSDVEMYRRFEAFEKIGTGVTNPQRHAPVDACPTACGLCSNHHSGTLLANIDLTNRCNLNCTFCFANARACGFVYEPSFDQIVEMMAMLRSEKPVPTPAVQFSGGEPTMRDDLFEIIEKAKEMGFSQVQVATNGIKIAKDPQYVQKLKDAGLSTIYLHFDGVTKETNPILETGLKVVEYCEKAKLGVVLVPTIINGKNDHEIGAILKYAADHITAVRGVNFQPVAFTGAASEENVIQERVTIPDLAERIEEQTDGIIKKKYFYPVPCVVPISDLVEAYTGEPVVRFTTHQHCGAATYVFVTEEGLVPINEMIDVDGFFDAITKMTETMNNGGTINKYRALLEGVKNMGSSAMKGEHGVGTQFYKLLGKTLIFQNYDALRDFHWNALFIGTMHFMDKYNYDLARVQRCCIHYATPDGRVIPFCTYNSGPVYREEVWKKFAQDPAKKE
ncbi:MAG: 7,8-dihydro-6-hydroxymethylpterin dimethyltransferase [Methanofollis sp.]|nr:7,8-dihydro-6-hydroxymethylpterin dimethyltransferase [Methanofollis sp.]